MFDAVRVRSASRPGRLRWSGGSASYATASFSLSASQSLMTDWRVTPAVSQRHWDLGGGREGDFFSRQPSRILTVWVSPKKTKPPL